MIKEIILGIIQGVTEFLPVSSSGHLALVSNLISEPNLFFFVMLHVASLLAIVIYFRKDLVKLCSFKKKENQHWYKLIILGIVPAGIGGYFFSSFIDKAIHSYFLIGIGFLVSSLILFSSKIKVGKKKIGLNDSLIIGFSQVLALFPGVSRSGMTTSVGILRKVKPEIAGKFSFIMFIPLMIGAVIQQYNSFYFSIDLLVASVVCFFVSLTSLGLFFKSLKNGYLWLFGFWTLAMGILCFVLGFS
ncbi:MAG: undecaprenyl-diphosphate phosphatase [Nanoarchaeota archaeon]|nr:undecaprenyl-diphosphate phosphatase [Nanoarchaeota archaeon]